MPSACRIRMGGPAGIAHAVAAAATGATAAAAGGVSPRPAVAAVTGGAFIGSVTTSGGVSYTDRTLVGVTSYGGNPIDPTGVVDSTAGLNAWIAAQINGTNAANHARYIFPPTATYKITTGLCLDTKSYVTLWGHAATSSAWIPGNATSYQDPGCTISVNAATGSNARSAFVIGSGYVGDNSITYGRTCTGTVVRGFNIDGNATTPGIYNASFETVNAFEVGRVVGFEAKYNKAWDIPGDLVRFRGDSGVCTNAAARYNWAVTIGRNGASYVEGDGQYVEYNVIDRCGYYGADWEPDDDTTFAYRTLLNTYLRYNTFGSFGSTGVGGTFTAIGNGVHVAIRDVTVVGNEVTGSTYGVYATGQQDRSLKSYVGQTIANSGAAGTDPHIQRLTFTGNYVSHANTIVGPVFHAGGVDTLVITDNDTNLSSGSFASLGPHDGRYYYTPTSVTNTGNT